VKIPKDVPFTSACLVGCGVMTGAGAVLYRSNVEVGQTAVVYGCGGVGLNALQALRVRRASRIIAIDVPGKTIPAGFIESQQAWTWITPYHQDPTLSATLKALRSARVTPEGLTLSTQAE
jgi:NADPH:quinone reductase-like Zn-dependent oxidoreductase